MNFGRKPSPAVPRVRIHRLVAMEFEEVLAWYAGLSPVAADHFITGFDAALEKIQRHPATYAPWQRLFRRIRLRRFPYLLIYHAAPRVSSVLALVHERREPGPVLADIVCRQDEWD
jgi:toxin ParE1/3/4